MALRKKISVKVLNADERNCSSSRYRTNSSTFVTQEKDPAELFSSGLDWLHTGRGESRERRLRRSGAVRLRQVTARRRVSVSVYVGAMYIAVIAHRNRRWDFVHERLICSELNSFRYSADVDDEASPKRCRTR